MTDDQSPHDLVGDRQSGLMQTSLHDMACLMEQPISLLVLHGVVYDGKTGQSCFSVLECSTSTCNNDPADADYVQLSMRFTYTSAASRSKSCTSSQGPAQKWASVTQLLKPLSACENGSANERLPDGVNALPHFLLPYSVSVVAAICNLNEHCDAECSAAGVDMLR